MPTEFDDFFARLLKREGGYSNDPDDKGGRTIYGVSERAHPELWRYGPPTLPQARALYERVYFKGPGFDRIPFLPLQEQLFDFAVNSGPKRAIRTLQRIVGTTPDGVLGPKTLAAILVQGVSRTNNLLVKERVKFLSRQTCKFVPGLVSRALEFLIP